MNTRRKLIQPKASAPSTTWRVMHEEFHPIFLAEAREHVEDWYNLGATGQQRDLFRGICSEIYKANPNTSNTNTIGNDHAASEPRTVRDGVTFIDSNAAAANSSNTHKNASGSAVDRRASYTILVEKQDALLMIKFYGSVLTDVGKSKAHAWIIHSSNRRRRDNFRDVFTGCQTVFKKKSVMRRDYVAPEGESYHDDRTYFHRSVDWTSLNARGRMQSLQNDRNNGSSNISSGGGVGVGGVGNDDAAVASYGSRSWRPEGATTTTAAAALPPLDMQRPSVVVAAQDRPAKRFTKPKSQSDGVNYLAGLGYTTTTGASSPGGTDYDAAAMAAAVAELKAKHAAYVQEKAYYVGSDGSTVFVAASSGGSAGGPAARSVAGGGLLAAVSSEPMSKWKVKVMDH